MQCIYICNDCGEEFPESMIDTDYDGSGTCPSCGSSNIQFLYEKTGHPVSKDTRSFFDIMKSELRAFVHNLPPELNPEDADEPEYDSSHDFDHFANQGDHMEPTLNCAAGYDCDYCEADDDSAKEGDEMGDDANAAGEDGDDDGDE